MIEAISNPPMLDTERPWMGLRSFEERMRPLFFGRTEEIRSLLDRIRHRPLTVLYGPSGQGKTSLLAAGVVPALRDVGVAAAVIRLGYEEDDAPIEAQLVEALSALAGRPLPAGVPFWLLLHDPAHGLCPAESADSPASTRPMVLILDQFEEVFTLGSKQKGAGDAVRLALAQLIGNQPPPELDALLLEDEDLALRLRYDVQALQVVISMREDFLHQLERWKRSLPAVMENRLELQPLSGVKARESVLEPGRLRCRVASGEPPPPIVGEATADLIVRYVANVPEGTPLAEIETVPPLLSLLCAELNEQRIALKQAQIQPDQIKGRAADILRTYYARTMAAHPAAVQRFVEERLLSPEGLRENTTLDTAIQQLRECGLDAAAAGRALDELVNARLLSVDERSSVRRLELTHDILTGVVRESRDRRWQRERERLRRLRRAKVGFASVLCMLLLGGVLYQRQRGINEIARARDLAEKEQQKKALPYLIRDSFEAVARGDSFAATRQSVDFLSRYAVDDWAMSSLLRNLDGRDWVRVGHAVRAVGSLSDSEFVVLDAGGEITWWSWVRGVRLETMKLACNNVSLASISPNGQYAALASGPYRVSIVDLAGRKALPDIVLKSKISHLSISEDSRLLCLGTGDWNDPITYAEVFDLETARPVGRRAWHHGRVTRVLASEGGAKMVSLSRDGFAKVQIRTGQQSYVEFDLIHQTPVVDAVWLATNRLATAAQDGVLRIWSLDQGEDVTSSYNPIKKAVPDDSRPFDYPLTALAVRTNGMVAGSCDLLAASKSLRNHGYLSRITYRDGSLDVGDVGTEELPVPVFALAMLPSGDVLGEGVAETVLWRPETQRGGIDPQTGISRRLFSVERPVVCMRRHPRGDLVSSYDPQNDLHMIGGSDGVVYASRPNVVKDSFTNNKKPWTLGPARIAPIEAAQVAKPADADASSCLAALLQEADVAMNGASDEAMAAWARAVARLSPSPVGATNSCVALARDSIVSYAAALVEGADRRQLAGLKQACAKLLDQAIRTLEPLRSSVQEDVGFALSLASVFGDAGRQLRCCGEHARGDAALHSALDLYKRALRQGGLTTAQEETTAVQASFWALFCNRYDAALAVEQFAERESFSMIGRLCVRMNCAHAHWLKGNRDKASAIYKHYAHEPFREDMTWAEGVLQDLRDLKRAGVTVPDEHLIEEFLR